MKLPNNEQTIQLYETNSSKTEVVIHPKDSIPQQPNIKPTVEMMPTKVVRTVGRYDKEFKPMVARAAIQAQFDLNIQMVFWGEIKPQTQFVVRLANDWATVIKNSMHEENSIPIILKAQTLSLIYLKNDQTVPIGIPIKLSFWKGLYMAWASCHNRQPNDIDFNKPIIVHISKDSMSSWRILKLEQL